MKYTKWYDDVFEVNFYYFIGWDWTEFKKVVKKDFKFTIDEEAAEPAGLTQIVSSKKILIFVGKKQKSSVLVHEALHAMVAVLDSIGQEMSPDNEEVMAYYTEAIYKNGSNPRITKLNKK